MIYRTKIQLSIIVFLTVLLASTPVAAYTDTGAEGTLYEDIIEEN